MLFRSGASTNSLTTRMYINNDGKVGINTTSPTNQLHIEGGLYVGTTSGVLLSSADRPMITRGWMHSLQVIMQVLVDGVFLWKVEQLH